MFRCFVLAFIFVISLHALNSEDILKRADVFMKSNVKSNQFRAYNDYKNLYLHSLMSDDKKLKIRSLQGIVKSGNKLNIDVIRYSKKLLKIQPKKKNSIKKNISAKKIKKNKKSKSKNKIKIKSSHKLKSVTWRNGRLVLKLDKKLMSKQVNYFTLYDPKKHIYKYVFDIHASMLTRSYNLKKENVNKIKLAQYNPNTLRLVIENNKKVSISFKKASTELIVKIGVTSKKTKTKIKKKAKVHSKVIPKVVIPKRFGRNKIIVIDAGHGGRDPGAIGYRNYREKIVVLQISNELKKMLRRRGYRVYMTRSNDKYIKLSNRTVYANKKKADIFISIHANAVGKRNAKKVHGIECYFLSKSRSKKASLVAEKENSADISDMNKYGKNIFLTFLNHHKILASNKLAIDLQRGMLGSLNKSYKVKDGGVREGPFWVLVGAQMPAVLVEVGFISHPSEAKRLVNRKYQNKMARGLADGIERYFANN